MNRLPLPKPLRSGSLPARLTTSRSGQGVRLHFGALGVRAARNFPGGPVVKAPHFHCRGRGLDPCSGN